jgi:hypothetical protein
MKRFEGTDNYIATDDLMGLDRGMRFLSKSH